jgi:hypothetical protein
MHWIAIALLALAVGWFHTKVSPLILAKVPASASKSVWAMTFFTGAVILIAVFVAAFALSMVGLSPKRA